MPFTYQQSRLSRVLLKSICLLVADGDSRLGKGRNITCLRLHVTRLMYIAVLTFKLSASARTSSQNVPKKHCEKRQKMIAGAISMDMVSPPTRDPNYRF